MTQQIRKTIYVKGMTCIQCERVLREALLKVAGVESASVSFKEGKAYISYDLGSVTEENLKVVIEGAGYEMTSNAERHRDARNHENLKLLGLFIFIGGLYLIINKTVGFNNIPEISPSTGFGMLFVIGLLTSLHCIAMCGGINLSQCLVVKTDGQFISSWKPSAQYNAGRVLSYTILGALVGGLGSVVGFSGLSKGLIAIIAGAFMIIMGLNLLDLFPKLKSFSVRIPLSWRQSLMGKNNQRGPFVVGLLNGLMPCGPLQAMQLYALGTGSVLMGGASMFFFSIGTVPLMLGFGYFATLMSRSLTKQVMKVSALLVVILGFVMLGRGFSLSGMSLTPMANLPIEDFNNSQGQVSTNVAVAVVENGRQTVTGEVTSRKYPVLVIEKGVPVKVNFHAEAEALNGCNSTLVIPEYNIQVALQPGDNFVEFTPTKSGAITYTCWMGMVSSEIQILDKIEK